MKTKMFLLGKCLFVILIAMMILPSIAMAIEPPEAICVPWLSHASEIPHFTRDGAAIRLKGIARGDATEFKWDYGDGGETGWMPIADPYNLGVQHVYSGVPGQLFIATLHVRNGIEEDQDSYRIQVYESSDLSIKTHLDVRKNMAIDEGLWWLHTHMTRNTYGAGAPGYEQPYGYWNQSYPLAAVGTAVDSFQLASHTVLSDYDQDPYVETIQRAMNYLLVYTYSFNISNQTYGDPDTNGNGIGLVSNNESSNRQTYIGGICMTALATSGAPNRVAAVGREHVYGRTYADIVQDMVDFFAYGQVDGGSGRGGWRYYANYSNSDMSTAQWPPLGMLAAEQNMGSTVPQFVRDELIHFLEYAQYLGPDHRHGSFGYDNQTSMPNLTKAAAGLICYEFLYMTPCESCESNQERINDWNTKQAAFLADPKIQAAIGFIYRHWNDTGTGWDYTKLHGNSYGMYGVMKAMRILEPDIELVTEYDYVAGQQNPSDTFDWFYMPNGQSQQGLAHYTVLTQQSDGGWDDNVGPNAVYDALATGWRLLVVLPDVLIRPPVAVICDADEQEYNLNQTVNLDGSCSYHTDERRTIIKYEWDFNYDGTFEVDAMGGTASIPGGYPEAGVYPAALRVTDDNPNGALQDITICEVIVHEPPHCPHAYIGGPYDGWIGISVKFDASKSWDPDDAEFPYLGDPNEFILIEWDLDNDGLFGADDNDCFGEPSDAVGVKPEWTWWLPHEGIIGLKVTDTGHSDDGQIFDTCFDYDFGEVKIGNHPPIADAGGPYGASTDACITLDGTDSRDIDPGDSITVAWDLDGDGVYDDSSDLMPEFCVSDEIGKVYDICLKVTDSYGETDFECTTVTIVNMIPVALDIKPTSCPNPFNVTSKGVLPVAILGKPDFDVMDIDLATVRLNGIAPLRSDYEDVATPIEVVEECECTTMGADGFMDLTLKFARKALTEVIGDVDHDDVLTLAIEGTTLNGTPIEGQDCIVIRGKHRGLGKADINDDGVVDFLDLISISEKWLREEVLEK